LRRSFGRSVRSLRAASAVVGITRPIRDWGLVRAGRPAGALDSVFPLAYAEPMTVPGRQREADARWDALGLRPDTFVVCFFGALGRQFDFDTVLRAAEALQRQRPDVRFVICGTGQRLPELQAAARRLTYVLVPGWLDQSDIWALMQRSACGLAPYVNEYSFTISLPNKIIEYFAGGLPVVSCLQGESRVLVEKHAAGVHYTPHDNADLARTIANLAADRVQRLAMARRARALYEREFSASLVYGQMIELLTQVASKGDYTLSRQGLHE
jgi:glycosyltransferase involved in cell wall biosynthesis